jgi:hypothetical protein
MAGFYPPRNHQRSAFLLGHLLQFASVDHPGDCAGLAIVLRNPRVVQELFATPDHADDVLSDDPYDLATLVETHRDRFAILHGLVGFGGVLGVSNSPGAVTSDFLAHSEDGLVEERLIFRRLLDVEY